MSVWKQHDTLPPMVIDCFDGDGTKPDLTQAQEVTVKVSKMGAPIWERTVSGDANGVVTVPLQDSDTAVPGTFRVKVFVRYPDGSRQHYPPGNKFMTMTVTR